MTLDSTEMDKSRKLCAVGADRMVKHAVSKFREVGIKVWVQDSKGSNNAANGNPNVSAQQ